MQKKRLNRCASFWHSHTKVGFATSPLWIWWNATILKNPEKGPREYAMEANTSPYFSVAKHTSRSHLPPLESTTEEFFGEGFGLELHESECRRYSVLPTDA